MSDTPHRPQSPPPTTQRARSRAVDAAKLDEVFGDVLPDTTSDERADPGQAPDRDDSWYLENRPPHH